MFVAYRLFLLSLNYCLLYDELVYVYVVQFVGKRMETKLFLIISICCFWHTECDVCYVCVCESSAMLGCRCYVCVCVCEQCNAGLSLLATPSVDRTESTIHRRELMLVSFETFD